MPVFRIYFVGADGRFTGPPEVIDFDTDAEALASFETRYSGALGIEVWSDSRLVGCRGASIRRSPFSDLITQKPFGSDLP